MNITILDYSIIVIFFAVVLFVGVYVSKKSGKSTTEYFLSGRSMPWWLLGFSMVATTFSTDTPNLVTNIVREDGVSGNWVWWCFLITGLLTVFVYAKLWHRSRVNTDLEFYSLRYGGKPAAFLRGFRAVYLGLIFNVLAMGTVSLAAIKIGQIILDLSPLETIGWASIVTVVFSSLGGFRGVVYTDFILFFVAMVGTFGAAYYCVNLPEVGGLSSLMTHPNVTSKISLLPSIENPEVFISILVIPLAVQWWSAWYPGAEPGGGGYIAQRMLAAKNETHAVGATFFFNLMHYALRPWPWILVALASLVVFPDLASIKEAFPNIVDSKLGHDMAYPAMITKLPTGLLGLVIAALAAAYMSTISTHLNWGASYIVNDFYINHVNRKASQKELVRVARLSTVILIIISSSLALVLENALQIFNYIIMFGAGTGLIFILRWFWWRINAWSEITAMFSSGVISILFGISAVDNFLFGDMGILPSWSKLIVIVAITTIVWVVTTFLTKPESDEVLQKFCNNIQPGGPGWKRFLPSKTDTDKHIGKWSVPYGIAATILGCVAIYSAIFAIGNWLYGNTTQAIILTFVFVIASLFLSRMWQRTKKIMF